jgi:four helix bundle protein
MEEKILRPHGGYKDLKAFQMAEIIHDATVVFGKRFYKHERRMTEQMVQAARSGKQNIAEGNMVSATSSKSELMLIGVARGSLEELLLDYQDYLRQNGLEQWPKDHPKADFIRKLASKLDRTYSTYRTYIEDKTAETAANTMICLIHQTTFLLNPSHEWPRKKISRRGRIFRATSPRQNGRPKGALLARPRYPARWNANHARYVELLRSESASKSESAGDRGVALDSNLRNCQLAAAAHCGRPRSDRRDDKQRSFLILERGEWFSIDVHSQWCRGADRKFKKSRGSMSN